MRVFWGLVLVLALPSVALADSDKWFGDPDADTTDTSVRTITTLSPGGVAYYENSSTTEDSRLLYIGDCPVSTFSLNPDEDGTATGAEVQIWLLDSPTGTCGSAANGSDEIDKLTNTNKSESTRPFRPWACVEITTNPNPDEFRVTAHCAGGR